MRSFSPGSPCTCRRTSAATVTRSTLAGPGENLTPLLSLPSRLQQLHRASTRPPTPYPPHPLISARTGRTRHCPRPRRHITAALVLLHDVQLGDRRPRHVELRGRRRTCSPHCRESATSSPAVAGARIGDVEARPQRVQACPCSVRRPRVLRSRGTSAPGTDLAPDRQPLASGIRVETRTSTDLRFAGQSWFPGRAGEI